MVTIYIGADHAGYDLKKYLVDYLVLKKKIKVIDLGTYSKDKKDDYPDFARMVADLVTREKDAKGILICGTGTGMVIAANRYKGARAVLAYDKYSAEMSRKDNDANILCLRGRKISFWHQKRIVDYWLKAEFENIPRHQRRIEKLDEMFKPGRMPNKKRKK